MKHIKKVLWIDDDIAGIREYAEILKDQGYKVCIHKFKNFDAAKNAIKESLNFDLIILDVILESEIEENPHDIAESRSGYRGGILLGRWIKNTFPNLKFIGTSQRFDHGIADWFIDEGKGFFEKEPSIRKRKFLNCINKAIGGKMQPSDIKTFIVHGHDQILKMKLKNYLQNVLHFSEPIILHEKPNWGRTIIDKFEDYADDIDIVFVILSPDDEIQVSLSKKDNYRQSRQNVLFELGYFYGKLQRTSGKVILLYKEGTQLPTDIQGLGYVNISNGIEASGEDIRRELSEFLL